MPFFLPRSTYNNALSINTVPHEVGHYFGLEHTFVFCKIPCFREPVSRGYVWRPFCPQNFFPKTCAVTGDCLTDTEADHEDNGDDVNINMTGNNVSCSYQGNRRDFWNDRFRPDATNLMSYMPRVCRRTFSSQQRAVMLRNMFVRQQIQSGAWDWSVQSPFRQFDRYEPDNADILARILPEDVSQERSMHGIGCGPDTEDWVQVLVPAGGANTSYVLEVADVPNFSNPVTGTSFFTAVPATPGRTTAGASLPITLLSNSNGVRRYLLPCNVFNSQAAAGVLVKPAGSGSVFGRYRLTLESQRATLAGATSVCLNNTAQFTLSGLLPNVSVTWRTNSAGVLTLPPNAAGSVVTATAVGTGNTTLVATINDNGCTYEVSQNVTVGTTQLYLSSSGDQCQGGTVVFDASLVNIVPGSLGWSATGLNNIQRPFTVLSPTSISIPMGLRLQYITVTVRGTDACSGQIVRTISGAQVQNCTGSKLSLYPNPSTERVELSVSYEKNDAIGEEAGEDFTATLLNGQGRPVLIGHSSHGHLTLDTRSLQPGLYQVRAQLTDGRLMRQQLSVQR